MKKAKVKRAKKSTTAERMEAITTGFKIGHLKFRIDCPDRLEELGLNYEQWQLLEALRKLFIYPELRSILDVDGFYHSAAIINLAETLINYNPIMSGAKP